MDLEANKTDGKVLPLTNRRIAASEWNQLVASCMAFITAAGFTPDGTDSEQFLNAFKKIAGDLELVGANTNLSNLTSEGQNRFVQLKSGVANTNVDYVIKRTAQSGGSWYELWKSGWIRQGWETPDMSPGQTVEVQLLYKMKPGYTVYFAVCGGYTAVGEANCVCTLRDSTRLRFTSGCSSNVTRISYVVEGYKADD